MSISDATGSKPKKILMITSSGGGGLIQAANAKEQEVLAKYQNLTIVRRDLLKDWVWKPIGSFFIGFWNRGQLRGSIWMQMVCVYCQALIDSFLYPSLFFSALYTLFKEDVDHIIDTQPMGTSAIIRALKIFNRKRGKEVRLEKVLVDLPTRKATHFFRAIKKLSRKDRHLVQLTAIAPFLEEGESEEEFWQQTCGLSAKEVNCQEVYVRQAFQAYKGKVRSRERMQIKVCYKNEEELRLMRKTFERGSICAWPKEKEVDFHIEPDDRVITVLLGSQPASEATLGYVKQCVSLAREYRAARTLLFVFCADHLEGEETLFRKVAAWIEKVEDYPKNLSVIPFSFQNEAVIAPLFHRSDATCTRSGGQTAMELMCVSNGEIWIHSEAKKGQDLLRGIPGWEAASAVYLQRICGAKIITPDTFSSHAHLIYQAQTGNGQALSNRPLESTA